MEYWGHTLFGKVLLVDGIGNLGFGEAGELFALGDKVLRIIVIDQAVVGVTAN